MNDRMEQEIEKTIGILRASMPPSARKKNSFIALVRLAASEISPMMLITISVLTLFVGAVLSKVLLSPMLTCFSTAPMPMLLLFHRYVCRASDEMRELEQTFKYSYSQMIAARTALISAYMFVFLLCLSAIIQHISGIYFLRLAFCGAVPSLLLCAALLWLSNSVHQDNIALTAMIVWVFLYFFALLLPFEAVLQAFSSLGYGLLIVVGFAANWICLCRIQAGGIRHANVTR